jgi:hypothetical protein
VNVDVQLGVSDAAEVGADDRYSFLLEEAGYILNKVSATFCVD